MQKPLSLIEKSLIRLSKSVLSEIEKDAVKKVLDDGYLGMGTNVKTFENVSGKSNENQKEKM